MVKSVKPRKPRKPTQPAKPVAKNISTSSLVYVDPISGDQQVVALEKSEVDKLLHQLITGRAVNQTEKASTPAPGAVASLVKSEGITEKNLPNFISRYFEQNITTAVLVDSIEMLLSKFEGNDPTSKVPCPEVVANDLMTNLKQGVDYQMGVNSKLERLVKYLEIFI